ncbi:hypothetical protein GQ457_06G000020 [Hibiscus cannabinus]
MWTARGASYTYPCTCTTCVAALACFGHLEETLAQAKHVAGSTSPFPPSFPSQMEFAYNLPRSVTFEETTFRQEFTYNLRRSATYEETMFQQVTLYQ